MTMSPQVSVIMPIFKPDFLATAIDSILAQTMPDFELILINDGSPYPQVAEIGDSYSRRDSRIRYIEQANRGLARTRNVGGTLASADYLMWMDDDDVSRPDRMKRQFDFMRKNPEVAVVGCTCIYINGAGEIDERHRGKVYPNIRENVIRMPPPSSYPDLSYFPACWMIKKSVYENLGGIRPWFCSFEDADFALRLEEKFPFAGLSETLYFYRNFSDERRLTQHPNAVLYDYAAKWAAICRRRGEADPINDTTDINFIFRHLPELPDSARHNFIWGWGKSRRRNLKRRNLSLDNLATIKQDLALLQQNILPADEKKFRQMKWKLYRTALLKGHWRYFLTKP